MSSEPWLRGPLDGVNPLLSPVLRALEQAQEDIAKHCSGLDDSDMWRRPLRLAPLGFHLRHIAGSLDRLTTYLEEHELSETQFSFLQSEMEGGDTCQEILALVRTAIERASSVVRALDTDLLTSPRSVGRERLPTTAIGLAIHLAEHTQRHVGQVISCCNLLEAIR